MPQKASQVDASAVEAFLRAEGLKHLSCRRRADTLVIESRQAGDVIPHIRLKKLATTLWRAEAATHTGRWEPMPLRGPLAENLKTIAETFPWLLAERL